MHYIAASYEHGTKPPKFILEEGLMRSLRYKTEKLYEKLKTKFGLTPDMIFMFDFDPNPDKRIAYFRDYFAKVKTQTFPEPSSDSIQTEESSFPLNFNHKSWKG